MDFNTFLAAPKTLKYSFLYLVLIQFFGGIAMLVGGQPVLIWLLPAGTSMSVFAGLFGLIRLSWIGAGLAAGILIYRAYQLKKPLFAMGFHPTADKVVFGFLLLGGISPFIAAILGTNLLLAISSARFVLIIAGLLKFAVTAYAYLAWKKSSFELF